MKVRGIIKLLKDDGWFLTERKAVTDILNTQQNQAK